MKRFHIIISGYVQGVGFRYSAKNTAQRIGVTGWIANRSGNIVEVVIEGSDADTKEMIQWLKKGPPGAYVKKCIITEEPYTAEFNSFNINVSY